MNNTLEQPVKPTMCTEKPSNSVDPVDHASFRPSSLSYKVKDVQFCSCSEYDDQETMDTELKSVNDLFDAP